MYSPVRFRSDRKYSRKRLPALVVRVGGFGPLVENLHCDFGNVDAC
jgi:hypothetical protein